jgi:nucleoside-diphosphate-sugar epimerase
MRAFVTGGSGFIGGHLIDALLRESWQVRALVHKAPVLQAGRVETCPGDITDIRALQHGLKDTDVLFHLASALGSSLVGRKEFSRVNTAGTEAVMEAARRADVRRAVHLSSAGVLGNVRNGEVADEDYPSKPISVYDRTKWGGEEIARRFAAGGMDIVIIRPGWAYGPRDTRTFKLIRAVDKGNFFLATKGAARQTPVYIDDLVRGILLGASRGAAREIYQLAGREILTAREIVEAIAWACQRKVSRFYIPSLPARAAAFLLEKAFHAFRKEPPLSRAKLSFFIHSKALSTEKAQHELGFVPNVDFRLGIRLAVDWYRENGWL